MDPLERRPLGRTGLDVTALGLGGTGVGGIFTRNDDATGEATVARAWELGIRYFDTAPYYGHGASERRYGAVLADKPRGELVLSTKVGRLLVPGDDSAKPAHWKDGEPWRAVFDYSPAAVRESLDASRERLGVERPDLIYVHDAHDQVAEALAGAEPTLRAMREAGETTGIGAGINWVAPCLELARGGDFDCFLIAGRYSLLDQSAFDELLPLCLERGLGIVIGGAFNSGILATGAVPGASFHYQPADAAVMERVRRIEVVCHDHGVPLPAAALQFPLAHPVVSTVLVGARSPREIEDNVRHVAHPIPAAFWDALKGQGLLRADVPTPEPA
jgi:aryl-alcohol dehydrogenase-like predicted oxidoreductase